MAGTSSPLSQESFLKREEYIRYSGILLTLSPIGNFLWSSACSGVRGWYQPRILLGFLAHIPAVLWFLWGLSFLAGTLMLKGKRSSWNFTLFILGVNIVFGITTFKHDLSGGWLQPTLSLIVNLALFGLIYVQEFHQRLERKVQAAREMARAAQQAAHGHLAAQRAAYQAAIMNRPIAVKLRSELPVHFEPGRAWAMFLEVSHLGFRVRSVDGEAPRQIEFLTTEVTLAPGITIKARFSAKIGDEFVFRFVDMTPTRLAGLHQWARRLESRGMAEVSAPVNQTHAA